MIQPPKWGLLNRAPTARALHPHGGNYQWPNTSAPSQDGTPQTAHMTLENLSCMHTTCLPRIFLRWPINPKGFWVVFVLSGRPLDGCNYHREGPQKYPKFAPRAHRGKSALKTHTWVAPQPVTPNAVTPARLLGKEGMPCHPMDRGFSANATVKWFPARTRRQNGVMHSSTSHA